MRHLGADRYGTWLGAVAGTVVELGTPGKSFTTEHATVRLVPPDAWWVALFFPQPNPWDVYCDITTPPLWTGSERVTMADLDLDLLRARADRRVEILDEDEFANNAAVYRYPAEVVDTARVTARRLRVEMSAGTEPFGRHCEAWFAVLTTQEPDAAPGKPA